jgi:hypothetical protein
MEKLGASKIRFLGLFVYSFLLLAGLSMAVRLPIVGADQSTWGHVLNTYLNTSMGVNGTVLSPNIAVNGTNILVDSINASHILANIVTTTHLAVNAINDSHIAANQVGVQKLNDSYGLLNIIFNSSTLNGSNIGTSGRSAFPNFASTHLFTEEGFVANVTNRLNVSILLAGVTASDIENVECKVKNNPDNDRIGVTSINALTTGIVNVSLAPIANGTVIVDAADTVSCFWFKD